MKPKLRARKMWANYHAEGYVFLYSIKSHCMNSAAEHIAVPVAVIPLDDVDSLVRKATDAYFSSLERNTENRWREALTAIGVLPRTKGGRK